MPASPPVRSLAAIVFTDVVGYSKLVHRDDANALNLVEEHFGMVRGLAPAFGGRVIKTIGDSVHLEFASAQSATGCAIAIQRSQGERNARVAEAQRFELRIGVHLGDVEHRDGDVYGDGVNIAARLQPLAPVGGIAISDHVRGQLRGELRDRFVSRGAKDLKNIDTPVEVFTIEASAIAEISVEMPTATPAPEKARSPAWRYGFIALGIASLVPILGLFIAFMPHLRSKDNAAIADDKSLAVLPFVNSSGDPANEYFSDGLSEELISTLGRSRDLKVIGRTSSFQFKNKTGDSRTIGKTLGVAYLVEGSVRKAAERVRIAVSLVKAVDGTNSWSESYDRELKDIFAVQTEIATAVADELKSTLLGVGGGTQAKPDAPPNGNVAAYQALLQGNFHSSLGNEHELRKAIGHYEEAVRLEPGYALAHAKLAAASTAAVSFFGQRSADDTRNLKAKAHAAIAKALRLGPDLADAHVAHCQVLGLLDLEIARAAAECARGYELAPQDPRVVVSYAQTQASQGRFDEAIALGRRAMALDPLEARTYSIVSRILTRQNKLDEAERMLRKVIELQPHSVQTHVNLGILRTLQGHTREGVELAKQERDPLWRTFGLAITHYANGDRPEADAALDQLIAEHANDGAYQIADVYAWRKEPDQMFRWLDQAWANRDAGVVLLKWDWYLAPYDNDPRFVAFAKKVGVMQ